MFGCPGPDTWAGKRRQEAWGRWRRMTGVMAAGKGWWPTRQEGRRRLAGTGLGADFLATSPVDG